LGVPEILVDIIRTFHEDMEARIRLDQDLLEEIDVNNSLRQGYTMAPTLFNLCACAVVERWLERVQGVGVGTCILYKLDNNFLEGTLEELVVIL